jgi:hypothetical protein
MKPKSFVTETGRIYHLVSCLTDIASSAWASYFFKRYTSNYDYVSGFVKELCTLFDCPAKFLQFEAED